MSDGIFAMTRSRAHPPSATDLIVAFEIMADFYGTNPTDDLSTISMEAWNTSECLQERPYRRAFLPNKANDRNINDFNDGVECQGDAAPVSY